MTMAQFSVVACILLGFDAHAQPCRMLSAIAEVESGGDRSAIGKAGERGMYQIGHAAWSDAHQRLKAEGHYSFPWSRWRDPIAQDMIAATHLRTLRDRFAADGMPNPSAAALALAWNLGYTGARRANFVVSSYAFRVSNLYHLPSTAR